MAAAAANPHEAAAALLKNEQFMKLFEKSLLGGGEEGGAAASMLAAMPEEGDPKREAWLKKLQAKLQEESMKAAKENLEQVQSDEQGQWMFVLPKPGFCIKCSVSGGGKIFINICQHERIAEPIPMTKEECEGMGDDEIRFRIPLSCGQARPDTDKSGRACKVYDVVVNPATLSRCTKDHEFRSFVASLCIHWIKQKYEPTMKADEFRNLNFKAKGQLEPQRIRLSAAPKPANALHDEIKLPSSGREATAPSQVAGTKGTGKLIEEVAPSQASSTSTSGTKTGQQPNVVLASDAGQGPLCADGGSEAGPSSSQPRVVQVTKEGNYDWSTHAKPSQSVFFRETVPASYYVELFIPTVQTIHEVDVRIGPKRLECFYVDETDDPTGTADDAAAAVPFLSVVFDYPVSEEMTEAKFVRKTHRLKARFTVKLPDETTDPRTAPERDATEVEEEEARKERARREAAWEAQQAQLQRQQAEEARVTAERKSYVENLAAVQSGDIPPMLRQEIDDMPKDQLPAMLHRLEGRVMKGDSVDELLKALPQPVLDAVIDYIRERLSLQPRQKTAPAPAPAPAPAASNEEKKTDAPAAAGASLAESIETGSNMRVEYNYAAKSEKLFGVAFHNRYLFALDN